MFIDASVPKTVTTISSVNWPSSDSDYTDLPDYFTCTGKALLLIYRLVYGIVDLFVQQWSKLALRLLPWCAHVMKANIMKPVWHYTA